MNDQQAPSPKPAEGEDEERKLLLSQLRNHDDLAEEAANEIDRMLKTVRSLSLRIQELEKGLLAAAGRFSVLRSEFVGLKMGRAADACEKWREDIRRLLGATKEEQP